MANHTIDCEFCGQDRRVVGPDCCEQRKEQQRKEHFDRLHTAQMNTAYLGKFGIPTHSDALGYDTKVCADDVVKALKKLEKDVS